MRRLISSLEAEILVRQAEVINATGENDVYEQCLSELLLQAAEEHVTDTRRRLALALGREGPPELDADPAAPS